MSFCWWHLACCSPHASGQQGAHPCNVRAQFPSGSCLQLQAGHVSHLFAQSRQQGPGDAGCRPRWDVPAMALDEARGEKGAACTVSLPVSGCDQPGAGGRGGEKVPATILLEVRVTSLCPEPSGVTARPKDPALDWPAPGFLHPTTGFSRSLERSAPFEFVQSSLWCLLRGLMEGGPGQTESQTCNDGFSGIAQFFRDGQSRSYGGSVVMSALSVARSGVRPICHWSTTR